MSMEGTESERTVANQLSTCASPGGNDPAAAVLARGELDSSALPAPVALPASEGNALTAGEPGSASTLLLGGDVDVRAAATGEAVRGGAVVVVGGGMTAAALALAALRLAAARVTLVCRAALVVQEFECEVQTFPFLVLVPAAAGAELARQGAAPPCGGSVRVFTKHLMRASLHVAAVLQRRDLASLAEEGMYGGHRNRWAGLEAGGLVREQAAGGVCAGGLPKGAPPSGARRAAAGHHRCAHRSGPTGHSRVVASSNGMWTPLVVLICKGLCRQVSLHTCANHVDCGMTSRAAFFLHALMILSNMLTEPERNLAT